MSSEQQLIHRAQQGDRAAQHEIYTSHAGYLYAMCTRYIVSSDDAKDVLQEAFIRIFNNLQRFEYRGDGTLRSWMTRIVVNEALKTLRRMPANEDTPIDNIDIADDTETDIRGISPADLHDMIRQLPQGYRTVLNLYVFEEKSHKEIAEMLGISEQTSASQYHRAKRLLKKLLKNHSI